MTTIVRNHEPEFAVLKYKTKLNIITEYILSLFSTYSILL